MPEDFIPLGEALDKQLGCFTPEELEELARAAKQFIRVSDELSTRALWHLSRCSTCRKHFLVLRAGGQLTMDIYFQHSNS